ncbi:hypothetical protein GCM10017559_34490 [Streptosporangium longisporum]|uniref:Uncharacterized protein n=1 Tax=Streptosporangium longisporum TaxID=46187 RepID=A0ABP6KLK6_9ACTN
MVDHGVEVTDAPPHPAFVIRPGGPRGSAVSRDLVTHYVRRADTCQGFKHTYFVPRTRWFEAL